MTEHNLTGVLAEIEAACGLAAALKLAGDFGGTEIYVPTSNGAKAGSASMRSPIVQMMA